MRTENLAIMFTDIKGYTERTSKQTHKQTRRLLERHASLVVPIIEGFEGRVIKAIGDAFLVVFRSPTAAVLCGMTIQDQLFRHNINKTEEDQIHLRVSVNVGEVLVSRGDVFGEPVNIASRVEGITPANEVYLTEACYLAMNKSDVHAEVVGSFELKGISEPVEIYRVPPLNAVRREDAVPFHSGPGPAVGFPRSDTSPGLLVLPFGGTHLARLENQVLTPARKRGLVVGSMLVLAVVFLLTTVLPFVRTREWEQLEALIGRGETAQAMNVLAELDHSGESERRRYFSLQQQLVSRMMERNENEAAVTLMASILPQTPEERADILKLHRSLFQQLLAQGQTSAGLRLLDSVTQHASPDDKNVLEERLALASLLLQKGRLDELSAQIKLIASLAPKDPRGKALNGHLHFALSNREDRHANMMKALTSYREALSIELAAGDDPILKQNVATAYSNEVKERRLNQEIINAADQLVERFLRHRAVEALLQQLDQPNNSKEARDRLAARIQLLGAEKEVDRVRLMLQDLEGARCDTKENAERTRKLIERLRDDGGRDPRVVGALVSVAQRHDSCEEAALDAVHRMVGERLGFMSADDIKVRDLVQRLKDSQCRKNDARNTEEVLGELVRMGDPRAVGPVLKMGAQHEACAETASRAAEALLGKRVVYETPNETRFGELLNALRDGTCRGKNDAAAQQDTIRALARHADKRAVGELLNVAKRGNACSDAALAAARQLMKYENLTLSCTHPLVQELRNRRCDNKQDLPQVQKTVEELVRDGDVKSVGELLQLAAKRNACSELFMAGARQLTRIEKLSLSGPAGGG